MPRKMLSLHLKRVLKLTLITALLYVLIASYLAHLNQQGKGHSPSTKPLLSTTNHSKIPNEEKEKASTSPIKTPPTTTTSTTTTTTAPDLAAFEFEKSEAVYNPAAADDPRAATDHDYYCDKYGEWLELTATCFIKKSFSFYLADKNEYRTFLILRKHNPVMNIDMEWRVELNGKLLFTHICNSSHEERIRTGWFVEEYGNTVMTKRIDLRAIMRARYSDPGFDFDKQMRFLNISVRFVDRASGNTTAGFIPVWVKSPASVDKSKQRSALLCSKCVHMQSMDFKRLFWWIEVNRLSGFNRIVVCNSSIPSTLAFGKIFSKYKEFVVVKQMRCVPNFLTKGKYKSFKYLKS
jgi:hypothetical protein